MSRWRFFWLTTWAVYTVSVTIALIVVVWVWIYLDTHPMRLY